VPASSDDPASFVGPPSLDETPELEPEPEPPLLDPPLDDPLPLPELLPPEPLAPDDPPLPEELLLEPPELVEVSVPVPVDVEPPLPEPLDELDEPPLPVGVLGELLEQPEPATSAATARAIGPCRVTSKSQKRKPIRRLVFMGMVADSLSKTR